MKRNITILALLCTPLASHADTILGFYAGAGQWQASLSGEVGESGQTTTLEELGHDKEPSNVIWARLEHPIPVIPNIKLMSTKISSTATTSQSQTFTLNGTSITATFSDEVTTRFDLSHVDMTLYYELLDNWINLDAGVTARQFAGYTEARSTVTGRVEAKLEGVIPMLYLTGRIDLPFTGFHIDAQTNMISFQGDKVTDISAQLGYELDLPAVDLGLNIGYRTMAVKVEELDDLYADAEVSGIYAELQIHF